MKKVTYVNASKKREARKFLFSFFNEDSIIGLAGPDINEYVSWCKDNKITNIELWENNSEVMMEQLIKFNSDMEVTYKFGDILNAEKRKNCIYDLDYCGTIYTLHEHVKKFKESKFIMTFCARKIGYEKCIELFFKSRDEKVMQIFYKEEPVTHWAIKTAFGKYIVAKYFDTTPMISFAKIN